MAGAAWVCMSTRLQCSFLVVAAVMYRRLGRPRGSDAADRGSQAGDTRDTQDQVLHSATQVQGGAETVRRQGRDRAVFRRQH